MIRKTIATFLPHLPVLLLVLFILLGALYSLWGMQRQLQQRTGSTPPPADTWSGLPEPYNQYLLDFNPHVDTLFVHQRLDKDAPPNERGFSHFEENVCEGIPLSGDFLLVLAVSRQTYRTQLILHQFKAGNRWPEFTDPFIAMDLSTEQLAALHNSTTLLEHVGESMLKAHEQHPVGSLNWISFDDELVPKPQKAAEGDD